ncbi:C2H2 Zn finger [Cryptosporidium sp. chipmunk genotype I]|uniref:C2H2 Zn finger n=1 Tax=Cryptosporidium sp. chipmunk genotype I TaxID=1280935 RepID=UPI00351A3760|nr:C2H2 Zn finger [Cryptosporidium sp. chipmunk genotype I]
MIDKSRRGLSPLIGYSIQNQGCLSADHQTCLYLPNQNFSGYKDFHSSGLMTFKQFTLSQDDNLAPNELIEMYDSYKTKYVQKHQLEFLENNRNSPIVLEKFHPIWIRKLVDERRNLVLKRIEVFSLKLKRGGFNTMNKTNNDVEIISHTGTVTETNHTDESNDSITVFGNYPNFETDLKSHIMVLTDIPSYISYLDITKFFNNDFPLKEGGPGKCEGFLDILLSPPRFTRGILNRQCYILFDNVKNRDSAIELIKGKTIKSSVTTSSIILSYNDTNNQMEDANDNEDLVIQQPGAKYSIYIIQAKTYNENCSIKVGQISKAFLNQERLSIDKSNIKKIIEKIESGQGINSNIDEIMESVLSSESMNIKASVDLMSLYLRFVHGIDYYSLSTSHPLQTKSYNSSNLQPMECFPDISNTKDLNSSDTFFNQCNGENLTKYNEKSFIMHSNLIFLSKGYIEALFKNKFRTGWQKDEGNDSESQICKGQIDDLQNQALVNQLEENVDILLKLPSIFDLIPQTIGDNDESLSFSWKRYCEQHTLRKKADRWQCGKCLKQFKGEEYVHKHLAKKHRNFLETIREEITFERIIKPSAEKFSYLIYPANADEFNVSSVNRRGNNHGNLQSVYRPKNNKHLRSNPFEKKKHFRDWDTPKQQIITNSSNDIRTSIRYDDL